MGLIGLGLRQLRRLHWARAVRRMLLLWARFAPAVLGRQGVGLIGVGLRQLRRLYWARAVRRKLLLWNRCVPAVFGRHLTLVYL